MLARITTFTTNEMPARAVYVEADVRPGLPSLTIVGLGDRVVRETRDRVRAALINDGFTLPPQRITVNIAPASLRSVAGTAALDLAVACAILAASGQVPVDRFAGRAVYAELTISGRLRPCARGTLLAAEAAERSGLQLLVCPEDLECDQLASTAILQLGEARLQALTTEPVAFRSSPVAAAAPATMPDLADVRGHYEAIEALIVAAAGGHHLLLDGPAGTGKTMLARRLPGILPAATAEEKLEIARIRSLTGLGASSTRPFRAPHHSISTTGLIGGGAALLPGEVTLANHGVLLLDELEELQRSTVDALAAVMADRAVVLRRGQRTVVFPAAVQLVVATTGCPCARAEGCVCSPGGRDRHRRRRQNRLMDLIDVRVTLQRPDRDALEAAPVTTSAAAGRRVAAAQHRQTVRLAGSDVSCNAQMTALQASTLVKLTEAARRVLTGVAGSQAQVRVIRVAQTIADLQASDRVDVEHVTAAQTLTGQRDAVAA